MAFNQATPSLQMKEEMFKSQSGKMVEAMVGTFQVPEHRAQDSSYILSLDFIRLKSSNPNPGTPIIYLEGGPGSSCTWQARNEYFLESWLPYLEIADVILFDQRGTGRGTQRTLWGWEGDLPENALVDLEVTKAIYKEANQKALVALEERGVDLAGYTTKENATDIDEFRMALDLDKISLFGFSYGTHLGLAYIRYFGDHVENAVLIGTEGPNHNYKLPSTIDAQFYKIAQMVKEDPNVNQDVPDFMDLYRRVIKKLESKPAVFEMGKQPNGEPLLIKVGPVGLNTIIRIDIGDASDIPVFPRLLYTIDQGDYSVLEWFARKRFGGFGIFGMQKTMDMASGASKDRMMRVEKEEKSSFFGAYTNLSFTEVGWPNYDLGESYRLPIHSNVRTLFMSGTLDFNTPPYQAEEVRWGFPNSHHIIVKNAGHEQVARHPKAPETIVKFLNGDSVDDVALFYPKLKFIPVKGESMELWHPSLGDR